jgi:hypothetical protein
MALKTKANIKTQLDAVASALTLAWADTVAGVAAPVKDPHHPLRDVTRLLDVSPTGVVTVNTAAWDALWNAAGTDLVNPHTRGASRNMDKVLP